jgi:pyruvate-formate lyase
MAALVEDKVSTGKTEAQAKSSVKSSITAYWKKQYLSGYQDTETRKRIIAILTETGLYGSRNDVATMCEGWVKASK